jgi:AhpD family alkylhydroperoxidase
MNEAEVQKEIEKRLKRIAKHYGQMPLVCSTLAEKPDLFVPYTDLSRRLLLEPENLSKREAELAAVAAGAALASEHCLDLHISQALKSGASREDVLEAIMIGTFMAMTCGLSVGLRKLQEKDRTGMV